MTDNISDNSDGPGVYNKHGTVVMTGCTVTANHANGTWNISGGDFYNQDRMTLRNGATVTDNEPDNWTGAPIDG